MSSLVAAARVADVAAVRQLVAEGRPVDGDAGAGGTPLWHACASEAADAERIAVAAALLDAGADPWRDGGGSTPLHAAAARGPLALVELLIRHGALEWQPDREGRPPVDAARRGDAPDRDAIVELLDRPVIRDASFRAAVAAIHAGDVAKLERLLDAEPRLLRDRIAEPDCYREAGRLQYFGDPRLFWFIANNPALVDALPPNIGDVARAMIARGVAQADLDYALELVMTSAAAREQGLQRPLIGLLLDAGAQASAHAIAAALGHRELAAVQALLDAGHPETAPVAAAMGRTERLPELLRAAGREELQAALGLAVINGCVEAAEMALDAGADPSGFLPVHGHSTPLHQAALAENLKLIDLLASRGARTDVRDGLWDGTPLDWATHQGKLKAKAFLENWS